MTDEPAPRLDPAELLGAFARNEVEFIAVGGFAALLHGAQRTTKDIDLCVKWSTDNLERVAEALRELHARLKVDSYIEVPIDAAHFGPYGGSDVANPERRCGRAPGYPP